jgi:hypothetical protein
MILLNPQSDVFCGVCVMRRANTAFGEMRRVLSVRGEPQI